MPVQGPPPPADQEATLRPPTHVSIPAFSRLQGDRGVQPPRLLLSNLSEYLAAQLQSIEEQTVSATTGSFLRAFLLPSMSGSS